MDTEKAGIGEMLGRIYALLERASVGSKPFWSVADLSAATGWSKKTIYNKVSRKEIPSYRADNSKMVFFDPDEIKRYILANKVHSEYEVKEAASHINKK